MTTPRTMALDVGKVRIGVALSDPLGYTAQPLLTLHRKSRSEDLRSLARLARKHEVAEIVVGNPLHLSGATSPWAAKVHEFAAELHTRSRLPVHLWDERLTSVAAHELLDEAGHPKRDRKNIIDQVAAVLILRGWMESRAQLAARSLTAHDAYNHSMTNPADQAIQSGARHVEETEHLAAHIESPKDVSVEEVTPEKTADEHGDEPLKTAVAEMTLSMFVQGASTRVRVGNAHNASELYELAFDSTDEANNAMLDAGILTAAQVPDPAQPAGTGIALTGITIEQLQDAGLKRHNAYTG